VTFFLPPQPPAPALPRWRFRFLSSSPRFVCPDNTWIRGTCEAGTLLKWAPSFDDGSVGCMAPAAAHEAIAVAVELYP
jgi:hypothetical protein